MPAPLLAVLLALTPAADPGPDLGGFDYRSAIAAHVGLVNAGKSAEAVAYLRDHSKDPNVPPEQAEQMQRLLAGVYAAAGKPEGHEIAGFKRLTSRTCVFYVANHGEKASFLLTYWFEKAGDGWKLEAVPVGPAVNRVANEGPECLEPAA